MLIQVVLSVLIPIIILYIIYVYQIKHNTSILYNQDGTISDIIKPKIDFSIYMMAFFISFFVLMFLSNISETKVDVNTDVDNMLKFTMKRD